MGGLCTGRSTRIVAQEILTAHRLSRFPAFAKFLKTKDAALADVVEQANEIIRTTLLAVKDKEENQVDFKTFQVYGFDFMIDADINVSLLEVNGSPAVAERLLKKFSVAVIETAIDPVFSGDVRFGSQTDDRQTGERENRNSQTHPPPRSKRKAKIAGEEESKSAGAELPGSEHFDVIYVNDGKDGAAEDGKGSDKAAEIDFEFELIGAAKKMADGGAATGGKMEKK